MCPAAGGESIPATAWDQLLGTTTARVAGALDQCTGDELGEKKHLEPLTQRELQRALDDPATGRPLRGCRVDPKQQQLPLPNWKPLPLGIDVGVRQADEPLPRCAVELKLRDLKWTLWDYIKMLDALELAAVERTYLLVGAIDRDWHSAQEDRCLELFSSPGLEHFPATQLFAANRLAWFDLLTGGSGRPTSVPELVSTRLITREPFRMDGQDAALICVAVEPLADVARVSFDPLWYCGDWPPGVEAPDQYLSWRRRHWALASAVAEAGGIMGLPALEALAGSLGFKYAAERGLYYRGERIFTSAESVVRLTPSGEQFCADWATQFAD